MSTHKNTWKAMERQVASFFGTVRTPLSGMCPTLKSDTMHPTLFIECKLRAEMPVWDAYRAQEKANKNLFFLTKAGLYVFDSKYLKKIIKKTIIPTSAKGLDTLFAKTEIEAKGKTTVCAVKKKGGRGWLLIIRPEHYSVILKEKSC